MRSLHSYGMLVMATLLCSVAFAGKPLQMTQVTDLRDESALAREKNLVLVLEFSSEYCGYCRRLEELFLLPMQRNADYDTKVLIRSVSLDSFESIIDFRGQRIDTSDFAARYGVSLTPTLLFLDASGKEVSEKLVGIWSEDFYGGYIDSRIEAGRQKLAQRGGLASGG